LSIGSDKILRCNSLDALSDSVMPPLPSNHLARLWTNHPPNPGGKILRWSHPTTPKRLHFASWPYSAFLCFQRP